ncbi:hypothetical protein GCM10009787_28380 [Streptomyces bangladeshensis]|uniref:Transposase n=1 Tax=Streptomyces bangladeshensis TaxID=295352 RepID=A0ABN3BGL2_9ACTN
MARAAGRRPYDPERSGQIRNRIRRGHRGGRPPAFVKHLHKRRNVVERCFNRLKQRRGIATRYDETAEHGTVDLPRRLPGGWPGVAPPQR